MANSTAKDYVWVCLPFLVGFLFGCIDDWRDMSLVEDGDLHPFKGENRANG